MSELQHGGGLGVWVVGVDLRPESDGAVRFGGWLAAGGRARLIGLHVIEEDHMGAALRHHPIDEIMKSADAAVRGAIGRAGSLQSFEDLVVIARENAERALAEAVKAHQGAGLIVGRHAGTKQRTLVRLGRVARRLLRQAEVPTVVVPPDLASLGAGPVLVATNLQEDCATAAGFAVRIATELQRPLLFAHVVSSPEDYGSHYLPEDSLKKIYVEHQQAGEAELAAWMSTHGFQGDRIVVQGSTVDSLTELAEARRAALIVTGSRRLSGIERLFLTSIGTELAASAPCAVAVVPPADVAPVA